MPTQLLYNHNPHNDYAIMSYSVQAWHVLKPFRDFFFQKDGTDVLFPILPANYN